MTPVMIIAVAVGALLVGIVAFLIGKTLSPVPPSETEQEKQRLLEAARAEADSLKLHAQLEAREMAQKARVDVDKQLKEREAELQRRATELADRERQADKLDRQLKSQSDDVQRKEKQLSSREEAAEAVARSARTSMEDAKARLEKVAGMTAAEAKAKLLDEIRDEARREAALDVKKIEDAAREESEQKARLVLASAIQRYASEYVTERTVATVPLPSDDMKGRIIGREGRNIRALEAATGIDLIIDDTPEAVVISCFNPVRREIARLALTRLIADGRIHPTRIEEVVARCTQEIEQQCKDAGEQAAFDLGLGRLHPELVRLVGKLKFRSSNAQNLLQHSIEVGFLSGAMASELGLPVKTARRAGLLHDIGKAIDQEIEGSHARVGAQTAKKYGEPHRVCHAIEAHHGEEPASDVMDYIIEAANTLSTQRPGARREMLESYVQRLNDLEKIATSFQGVEKAYAIQAGREVRVMVEHARVTDEQARMLSKDIARKVEAEMTYPGLVKVSVIRESRSTEYAK